MISITLTTLGSLPAAVACVTARTVPVRGRRITATPGRDRGFFTDPAWRWIKYPIPGAGPEPGESPGPLILLVRIVRTHFRGCHGLVVPIVTPPGTLEAHAYTQGRNRYCGGQHDPQQRFLTDGAHC